MKAINEAKVEKEDILLFDRGIARTGAFVEFDEINLLQVKKKVWHCKKKWSYSETTTKRIRNFGRHNLYEEKSKLARKHNLRLIKIRNKAGMVFDQFV